MTPIGTMIIYNTEQVAKHFPMNPLATVFIRLSKLNLVLCPGTFVQAWREYLPTVLMYILTCNMEDGARIIGNCSRVGRYVKKVTFGINHVVFGAQIPVFLGGGGSLFFPSHTSFRFLFFFSLSFLAPTPHAQSLPLKKKKLFFSRLNFFCTFPFCPPPTYFLASLL
ncbi:hypothetical protein F4775DRAFT_571960 [Biscogniauxia sp. FL1348]|nr:hypothetical protein F4775DRAFT_571960 [Biscogniauxia sp. FL1348]